MAHFLSFFNLTPWMSLLDSSLACDLSRRAFCTSFRSCPSYISYGKTSHRTTLLGSCGNDLRKRAKYLTSISSFVRKPYSTISYFSDIVSLDNPEIWSSLETGKELQLNEGCVSNITSAEVCLKTATLPRRRLHSNEQTKGFSKSSCKSFALCNRVPSAVDR